MKIRISEKITNLLIGQGIINVNNQEVYKYGFHESFLILINILTTLVLGALFDLIGQSLLFLLGFIPLRTYAGGFHAKTELRCYFTSIIQMITVLLVIKWVPWNPLIYIIIMTVSVLIILALAPVNNSNNLLNNAELSIYRKITILILCTEISIIFIFIAIHWFTFGVTGALVLCTVSISLILGKIKNYFSRKTIA